MRIANVQALKKQGLDVLERFVLDGGLGKVPFAMLSYSWRVMGRV
jgi:hypothetical protein